MSPDGPCGEVAKKYVGKKWTSLSEDAQDEIMHCYYREVWMIEKATEGPYNGRDRNTTCDILMLEYKDWSSMDAITKGYAKKCQMSIASMEATKKMIPELDWVPNSFWSDSYLPYLIVYDISKCFLINWQFWKDRALDRSVFQSDFYSKNWISVGLSVQHYQNAEIVNDETYDKFLSSLTIEDYMKWNSVESCIAYDSLIKIVKRRGPFDQFLKEFLIGFVEILQ